ncbi:tetratricopeptide repeat protein [Asticcacaulis sp.]|uniref:tetratricopeptide repeat protein n=1 Tax=Asticcacaulis sp. TaxID=1872648 RepID=UPI002D1C58C2|nr:tetratricopeptide repeat protein [Asticcacaulis sp.]HTM80858.1 tetratricopeptide repeat protein [Asticcacaulis sp.]
MISMRMFGLMAAAFFVAAPALAEDATPRLPDVQIVECRTHDATQEKADQALAMSALDLMQAHDIDKLNARLPDLKAALGHAPDVLSHPEHCGDSIIVYSDELSDVLTVSAMIQGHEKEFGASKVAQHEALPYPLLAFVVGWIEFENEDFQSAHDAYAKGLINDPNYHSLIMEDTLTLAALHRSPEALGQLDAYLARNPDLPDAQMANALRKRGYVLVELERWDEAETAYKDSLKLEPDDETAQSELEYIAQNRPSKPAN